MASGDGSGHGGAGGFGVRCAEPKTLCQTRRYDAGARRCRRRIALRTRFCRSIHVTDVATTVPRLGASQRTIFKTFAGARERVFSRREDKKPPGANNPSDRRCRLARSGAIRRASWAFAVVRLARAHTATSQRRIVRSRSWDYAIASAGSANTAGLGAPRRITFGPGDLIALRVSTTTFAARCRSS